MTYQPPSRWVPTASGGIRLLDANDVVIYGIENYATASSSRIGQGQTLLEALSVTGILTGFEVASPASLFSALSYGTASPIVGLGYANGTPAAPTKITSGQSLGALNFYGRNDTTWLRGATVQAASEEDFGDAAAGTKLLFITTPAGSATPATGMVLRADKSLELVGALYHQGSTAGFFNTAPTTKPTVTGSKGANDALTSLMTALSGLGLVTDSTS